MPRSKKMLSTQNDIFLNILDDYFKNKEILNEYDFVSCLSLTYYQFRNVRNTTVDTQNNQDFSDVVVSECKGKNVLGVFPLCDAIIDEGKQVMPRFLKKFSEEVINSKDISARYRVNSFEIANHPLKDILLSSKKMMGALKFTTLSYIIFKIFIGTFNKNYFLRSGYKQKLTILKSLFLFELNHIYFSKINTEYIQTYDKLYLTNFYSPENLGLIRAFIENSKDVVDLQHGVQKNVVAYEHNYLLPLTIRPTKFLTWFNAIDKKIPSAKKLKVSFTKLESILKNGSGLKILISLQPSNTVEFFKEVNLLNLSSHFVKIRPHPRRILSQNELKSRFQFDFIYDSDNDIGDSLTDMDLHLTEYSSCVLDSIKIGIPSICFHPIAYDYFSDLNSSHLLRIHSSIQAFLTSDGNVPVSN